MDLNEVITVDSNMEEIVTREYNVDPSLPRDSPISSFYVNKTVLLTGPTGFLGHLLLEKLLRIGVKCVYVLMRPKKNRSSQERLQQMYNGPVFQHLHKYDAHFMDRVKIVSGDLSKPHLGIESEAEILLELKANVEIFIHAAADVRFNEPLYDLVLCNLIGTRDLLELAKDMRKIEIFVYLSTAFSNCKYDLNENIAEKFYEPPMNADILIDYVQNNKTEADRELLKIISPNLIQPWPNNYTFSKALSESIVRRYGMLFPIAVIRPTIIISTYADPIPAWSNSYGGMNGVTAGIGSGLLRNLFWKNIELNIVCADFVTNGSLAVAWHSVKEHKYTTEPKIYHVNRISDNLLFFDNTVDYLVQCGQTLVNPMNSVWYPVCQKTYSNLHDDILTILYQVIPSLFMDLFIKSPKYKLMPLVRKIMAMAEVIKFFNHNNFIFANENLTGVIENMTEYDRKYFLCDPHVVNWEKYYVVYVLGARLHLLRDSFSNYKKACQRMKRLKITHYTVKYLCILILLYVLYILFV